MPGPLEKALPEMTLAEVTQLECAVKCYKTWLISNTRTVPRALEVLLIVEPMLFSLHGEVQRRFKELWLND